MGTTGRKGLVQTRPPDSKLLIYRTASRIISREGTVVAPWASQSAVGLRVGEVDMADVALRATYLRSCRSVHGLPRKATSIPTDARGGKRPDLQQCVLYGFYSIIVFWASGLCFQC